MPSLSPMHDIVVGQATHHASARERIASALRRAVSYSGSPAKELARRLDLTPNGAALLLRGETEPRARTLLAACREFDEVWEEVRSLSNRHPTDAESLLDELATKLRGRRGG